MMVWEMRDGGDGSLVCPGSLCSQWRQSGYLNMSIGNAG